MNFILHLLASPFELSVSSCALRFAEAVLVQQHKITGIFFSHEAVQVAQQTDIHIPTLTQIQARWSQMSVTHQIPLWICSTAAFARGVQQPLPAGFLLAGLGQFVSSVAESDRLITFHE